MHPQEKGHTKRPLPLAASLVLLLALIACGSPGDSGIAEVTIEAPATLLSGEKVSLRATVTGSGATDPSVTWRAEGGGTFADASANPVDYTAPEVGAETTVRVVATSVRDPGKAASQEIRVQAPSSLEVTFTVDTTLRPPVASLPGFEDGEPRPIALVTGDDGAQAAFIANELWLQSDEQSEVEALVARWQGTVLRTIKPADYGVSGLSPQYLVRVSAAPADAARLGEDLRTLDPNAAGEHNVSSQSGLDLIALSSREAAAGLRVGINWLGTGGQFRGKSVLEAPSGPALAGVAYNQNAFGWPSHSVGSTQDIGVAEAWRALDLAGKLNNRVKLAVLDMGFKPDADLRAGWLAISNVPLTSPVGTENLLWCGGGTSCPWHGTNVVSAAMALPGNNYGSAGPAGPIADPVIVFTSYDFFTSITALGEARLAGVRIANMSYGAPVPWTLGWSVLPFEAATKAFQLSGMLLFAAAGNEGKNVDAEGCTAGLCWERTWYTPCENAGVICVGGLAGNSKNRAGGSNYGGDQVDIFAPYTLWLGPDPASPANQVQVKNGTSFSSPFAAGVAALVWAANPNLSAGQVEDILIRTAHTSPDSSVRRYVNALAAVMTALGNSNFPPDVAVVGDYSQVPLNVPVTLTARVEDFEDPAPCCTVIWSSDRDGSLGSGNPTVVFTTVGARTVTATARDSAGAQTQARVTITVVNNPPRAVIHQPPQGDEVFRTASVTLRGRASDRNEPQEQLACNRLSWTSSVANDPFPATGCELEVVFSSNGPRTLTLTATDPQGASDTATVSLTVVDPPPNLPPFVQITSPEDRAPIPTNEAVTLSGTAVDPEGETPLSYQWTVKLNTQDPIVVGNAPSVQWTPADSYDFSGEGTYIIEVRLNVTDPAGNTGTDVIVLEFVLIF